MKKSLFVFALLLLLTPSLALASWGSFGSDHRKLKGLVIAAVGTVSQESRFLAYPHEQYRGRKE
jgi:hypothetical protein